MLVAIVRKRLGLEASLYQILQILSVTLFEKTPILQALQPSDSHENLLDDPNQLIRVMIYFPSHFNITLGARKTGSLLS